jgi:hypothetical protein
LKVIFTEGETPRAIAAVANGGSSDGDGTPIFMEADFVGLHERRGG